MSNSGCVSAQRCATPLGPPEASDGEVSTVWEGEAPSVAADFDSESLKSLESDCLLFHLHQGFQQKFSFHSKEIVAISCSWCKQAVSPTTRDRDV